MALKKATNVGGDFLDLRALCESGPVLVVFKIKAFLPGEPDNFKRNTYPVEADALICSGKRAGEVHTDEVFKFAPANVLRGVSAKESDQGAPPANEIGDEVAVRVNVIEKKGSQPFVGLDTPSDVEYAEIEKVHANGKGWEGTGKALAGAGASTGGGARPWEA